MGKGDAPMRCFTIKVESDRFRDTVESDTFRKGFVLIGIHHNVVLVVE
jgi:hypothetical protein